MPYKIFSFSTSYLFFLPFLGFVIANIAVYFYLSVGRVERHTEKAYSGLNPASTISLWTDEGPCLRVLWNVHILRWCIRWISDFQEQSALPCQNVRSSSHQQSFWLAPPRAGCLPLHRAGSAGISESSAGLAQPLCGHRTGIAPLLCSRPGVGTVLTVYF